jgi:hypothetical protein
MRPLKDHIRHLQELKIRHETAKYRHYTRDSQAILLELILKEIESLSDLNIIPEDIYLALHDPRRCITNDIEDLCKLYRSVILLSAASK